MMTKDARVSEQVTYGTGGKENTVVKSSNATQFVYATNRVAGMGSNSKLNVIIKLQGVIAVDTGLVTDQNGTYQNHTRSRHCKAHMMEYHNSTTRDTPLSTRTCSRKLSTVMEHLVIKKPRKIP